MFVDNTASICSTYITSIVEHYLYEVLDKKRSRKRGTSVVIATSDENVQKGCV